MIYLTVISAILFLSITVDIIFNCTLITATHFNNRAIQYVFRLINYMTPTINSGS